MQSIQMMALMAEVAQGVVLQLLQEDKTKTRAQARLENVHTPYTPNRLPQRWQSTTAGHHPGPALARRHRDGVDRSGSPGHRDSTHHTTWGGHINAAGADPSTH